MIEKNEISEVGLGIKISVRNFVSSKPDVPELLEAGRENKINLLDIVNVLGISRTENRVGRALDQLNCREDFFVITKGGIDWQSEEGFQPAGDPETIRKNVEKSLQKLRLEAIDCFQVYWPDKSVPLDETVGQLAQLKSEGLIRNSGVANFSLPQLKKALRGGDLDFIQLPYNPYRRGAGDDFLAFCRQNRLKTIGYEGLCHGFFTDEFLAGELELENSFQGSTDYIDRNYMLFKNLTKKIAEYLAEKNIDTSFTSTIIKWNLLQEGIDHEIVVGYEPEHVKKIAEAREVPLEAKEAEEINKLIHNELSGKLPAETISKVFPDHSQREAENK